MRSSRSPLTCRHAPCPPSTSGQRLPGRRVAARAGADKPDLVTRAFGALFGRLVDTPEPGGMKRLSGSALTEQYPAPLDESSATRADDSAEAATLRRLLAATRLEGAPLELAYDAEVHGWSVDAFLARVATRGASVLVAVREKRRGVARARGDRRRITLPPPPPPHQTTAGGAIVGGYAPRSWLGIGEEKAALSAFLFTWPDGDTSRPATKLPKVGGPGLALVDRPGAGPQWGAEGLTVPLARGAERRVKCRLGTYYARRPDGARTLFADGEDARATELTSLRVYVAAGNAEAWELDGVVWKTSA